MQVLGLRRIGAAVDHLLRPGKAAENARGAAAEATGGVERRQRIEREVGALTEDKAARDQ